MEQALPENDISLREVTIPDGMPENGVQAYLARIGFTGKPTVDLATLSALQKAHIYHVPYENLDILRGAGVSVDLRDVFDKVVTRRRGGYCFEMNGLFAWLLRSIGFDVTEYYGRYLLDEPVKAPMRRHRILCVRLDGNEYICDVGVGVLAPVYPLLLTENAVQTQDGERFRIVRHPVLGYVVEGVYRGKWDRLYSFTPDPQYQIDFEMPNHWCVTHPDSPFRKYTMVFMRTPEGRNTAADVTDENGAPAVEFRRFTADGVTAVRPKDDAAFRAALLELFGIRL